MKIGPASQRLFAVIAALGSLLALALVMLAPSAANAATTPCKPGYPGPIATTTSLDLSTNVAPYGTRNVATVTVTAGTGNPGGRVDLTAGRAHYVLTLSNGTASHALPRTLPARHTYTVAANYRGNFSCQASGASKSYTVVRASTSVVGPYVSDITRGHRPYVNGRVTTPTGVTVTGRVRVALFHNSHRKQYRTVFLNDGRFHVSFAKVYARGQWTAKASKLTGGNFRGSTAAQTFQVTR